jgi:hypothetical protein
LLIGQAIGQVLSFGVGVALSPVPIIAVVLMLATDCCWRCGSGTGAPAATPSRSFPDG